MKKRILFGVLAVTLVCALAGAGTMAYFSSQAVSSDNKFTAGTLILGGSGNQERTFDAVTFENLMPGETTAPLTTEVRNVGTLPLKMYRLTAAPDELKDDPLANKIMIDVYFAVEGESVDRHVFNGYLSQLYLANGGHFDPIVLLAPGGAVGDEATMKIVATLDADVGNEFQGQSVEFDLTIYAAQMEMPLAGQSGEREFIVESERHQGVGDIERYFIVYGKNDGNNVQFDFDWEPNWIGDTPEKLDAYNIYIKHHSGSDTDEIHIRYYPLRQDKIEVVKGGISESLISYNDSSDTVTIDKDAFGDWEMLDVKFSSSLVTLVGDLITWLDTPEYKGWNITLMN